MARFYLTSENSRGSQVSAAGRSTGQTAHLRGWNVGIEVQARPRDATGDGFAADEFDVYVTGGSNGGCVPKYVGTARLNEDGEPEFVATK